MQSQIVILGTGGTIAGRASDPADLVGYKAAAIAVDELVAAVPPLAGTALQFEQLAQIDSKDMGFALWQRLARSVAQHLARTDVAGAVITHGTDTLEETAYFLHRVLAPDKPVVLSAAMRPATALQADGPQNLLDAVSLARWPGARGVVAVLAGTVHAGATLRKVHTFRLDAFSSGDAGPLGYLEQGRLRQLRTWPQGQGLGLARIAAEPARWPWVEILSSHAGADARAVDALVAAGVAGLVVAGVGNGHVHADLMQALARAAAQGVAVRRTSRCLDGPVIDPPGADFTSCGTLTPVQARIELMLALMQQPAAPSA